MKQRLVILFVLYLLGLGVFITALRQPAKSKTPLLSPLVSERTQTDTPKTTRTVSFYITTSQGLLNKARDLSANPNQTTKDKEKILTAVAEAIGTINAGISQYPNDDRLYAQRANIYESVVQIVPESLNLAIQDLNSAVRLNSQNPQYPLRLANLYLGQKDFVNASIFFHQAHLLDPTNVQTVYNLADALEKSGQYSQANYYFDKLITLLPQSDSNLTVIKERQAALARTIHSPTIPQNQTQEVFGVEESPLQQANVAKNLVIAGDNSSDKLLPAASEITSNATSGEAFIAAGDIEITINTPFVTEKTLVYVDPIGNAQNKVVYLKAKGSGWFKVGIDTPTKSDIKFKWWTIN